MFFQKLRNFSLKFPKYPKTDKKFLKFLQNKSLILLRVWVRLLCSHTHTYGIPFFFSFRTPRASQVKESLEVDPKKLRLDSRLRLIKTTAGNKGNNLKTALGLHQTYRDCSKVLIESIPDFEEECVVSINLNYFFSFHREKRIPCNNSFVKWKNKNRMRNEKNSQPFFFLSLTLFYSVCINETLKWSYFILAFV